MIIQELHALQMIRSGSLIIHKLVQPAFHVPASRFRCNTCGLHHTFQQVHSEAL